MQTKVILFDADGVAIAPHPYFSERLEKEYGIPREKVLPFFKNEFKLCTVGKADIKTELKTYLPKWEWSKSVDEFLKLWFESELTVNMEVLEIVSSLRERGVQCYLASDNEKYRAAYILNEMSLKEKFDGAFFSCELGYTKSQSEFYKLIMQKLVLKPEEIMYWDDDPENVQTAKDHGIQAFHFKSAEQIKYTMASLLNL
ncbi:MAG: HAD family hydrolase [Candidatus Liptonbacteria bacterium]|nr:HAD family hydrolase [Candidatus Liptonbacteria bacterium]